MERYSEVRTCVKSFRLSKDSYAIYQDKLKSRHARKYLLVQMLVRDLLTLILNGENDFNLMTLYDSLNSHILALEV